MPSTSKAQQRLFCMALAVRKGDLARKDVNKSVLDIVDSDMTNKQIEDFTVLKESLASYLTESFSTFGTCTDNHYVFVVIKPGFTNLSQTIIDEFSKNGFEVYQYRPKLLQLSEAKRLYRVHSKEPFYNDLCKYMASGISVGILFTYKDKEHPLDEVKEIKDAIREKYGESEMRNVLHSSDTEENIQREASIYFYI